MNQTLRETVKAKYGEAALRVAQGGGGSCCGGAPCGSDPISGNLYNQAETALLPEQAVQASLRRGRAFCQGQSRRERPRKSVGRPAP